MSLKRGKDNTKPTDTQEMTPRARERQLTEKGRQLCEEETKRHLKAFMKAYESWKRIAKDARTKLKKFCLKEDLGVQASSR